ALWPAAATAGLVGLAAALLVHDVRKGYQLAQAYGYFQARGANDPVTLPKVNPGRDAAGNCKPCPPGVRWLDPGNAHGSTGGTHATWIEYNQNPQTCECFPKRGSGPTAPF